MKTLLCYTDFCKLNDLDPESNELDTITISITKSRKKYLKYLSYHTERTVSEIMRSYVHSDHEDLCDVSPSGHCDDETYAVIVHNKNEIIDFEIERHIVK